MADRLELATFEPCVGDTFAIVAGDASIELTLTEANKGPWQPHGGPETAFELMFRGPSDPVLPQATYRLEHRELGALDIFIVPLERGNDGAVYQAVFN